MLSLPRSCPQTGQPQPGLLDARLPTGRLILTMLGAIAELERALVLERQREGIAKAQREGKYKGRAPTVRRRIDEITRLKDAGVTPTEIAIRLGIGRASVYRVLAEADRERVAA